MHRLNIATILAGASLTLSLLIGSTSGAAWDDLDFQLRSPWSTARSPPPVMSLAELGKRQSGDSIENDPDGQGYLWRLSDTYSGNTFFDEMTFWDAEDPTNGSVIYVNRERAFDRNLTYIEPDGTVVMQSDMVSVVAPGGFRESVRIQTKKAFNGGLFILDLKKAPWGCSVWPAYWMTAAIREWPRDGEIDIFEGTHDNEHNQVTWHTSEGCELDQSADFTGTPEHSFANMSAPCLSGTENRFGCGVVEWSRASYGADFNEQGGGIFAMKWDEFGISVWSFFRAAIPEDLRTGRPPTPSLWGPPSAMLLSTNCNITKHFVNHVIVFDITFCGHLAGNNYEKSGCPRTCAERIEDPANFVNASWHINALQVYQKFPIHARVEHENSAEQLVALSGPYLSSFALLLSSFAFDLSRSK